jgi:hypothetical protein
LNKKGPEKRSPLKAKPLRMPGQSLQEEINARVDKMLEYVILMSLALGIAGMEWFRWFFKSPPHPLALTSLAAIVWAYGIWKIVRTRRALKMLKQARDGEKVIGQSLERLREKGYRVFHDIVGDGFNIDHVLIGPTGIYSIETKTISKPAKGACEVSYDGEKISVNGFTPDRDPIVQAKAQANWLHAFVKEAIGNTLDVRPIVLYPGWYVKPQPKGVKVWVLNPDALPGFIRNEKTFLDAKDVQSIEYCLATYSRTSSN